MRLSTYGRAARLAHRIRLHGLLVVVPHRWPVIEKKPAGHVTADPMQLVHARFVVGVHADRSYCVVEHAAAQAAEHIAISTCSQCNRPDAAPV
jgi:hypothetical protein